MPVTGGFVERLVILIESAFQRFRGFLLLKLRLEPPGDGFKRASDGVAKLLEINPRFPGTLPLTTRAGIDIPALLVAEMAGLPLPDRLMPFVDAMMVRYLSEQFIDQSEWRHLCPT